MRTLNSALFILLSVPVLAQTPADLSTAEAQIRTVVAATKVRLAAVTLRPAQTLPAPAAAPKPGVSLTCRSADGRAVLTGTLSADRKTLENSWSGHSPLIDASKPFVDDRCGTTRYALSAALNFEVTPPHAWDQDILQIRPQDLDSAAAKFAANLHYCSYDGEWSSSSDVELTCERAAP
ncbi:MAG: hypothetical protein ACHQ51_11885 [Elusimicrobiota bacterium]